jgi:hypothetical protein
MKSNNKPPMENENVGDVTKPRRVTLDTIPPHGQDAESPLTGGNMRTQQDYVKTDPWTEGFLRKLDYPDEEPADLLHMVTPTKEELETLTRAEPILLTPVMEAQ